MFNASDSKLSNLHMYIL